MTESLLWSVALSHDSRWLASGHYDGNVRLWNLRGDTPSLRVLEGHTDDVRSVAFSSDGKKVVSGSLDWSIKVWDVQSGMAIGAPIKVMA